VPAEVTGYLAALPEAVREALLRLRGQILAVAPEAEERLSYGVPSFKFEGRPLVSYGAGKGHCAFYVQSAELMEAIREDLTAFDMSKGTIRFQSEKPLPEQLVSKLVQARIGENRAAETARKARARTARK
jgi:uncharacterized protein YdhG (YjbR/CyaY superfamily)